MKKLIAIFAVLLAMVATVSAQALSSQTGKVIGYIASQEGTRALFIFKIENNVTGGFNSSGRFAVDSTSPRYKGIMAVVMTAYLTQTPINVFYLQTNTALENSWDAQWVCVGDIPC